MLCSIVVEVHENTTVKKIAENYTSKVAKVSKEQMKGLLNWASFLTTFVLNKMCGVITYEARTDSTFK
jgi:hypothetical protein